MHAAIKLQQAGKSVIVVEAQAKVGGHVETYIDPIIGSPVDVGVLYYHNISAVTDFAAYVNVPLEPVPLLSSPVDKQILVDFTTGTSISHATVDSLGESIPAYTNYYQLLAQYDYLTTGFHLPSPVPEDLWSSWSEMITKYDLAGLAYNVDAFNQGWVDILNMPALYVLKGFGKLLLQSFVSGYEVRAASHNNQELFEAAAAKLGADAVLLQSKATRVRRDEHGTVVLVSTPAGLRKFAAKKLLITVPPLLDNLDFLRLDEVEQELFSQFSCGFYWNGVLRNSGLPDDISLYGAGAHNPYFIVDQPGMLDIIPSGVSGLHRVYYGSPDYLSDDQVSKLIIAALRRSSLATGYNAEDAELAFLKSHAPYHCTVSADQIKAGFYGRLEALQGKKSTFYTGAAWQAHDSGSIWQFTEAEVLPLLLA